MRDRLVLIAASIAGAVGGLFLIPADAPGPGWLPGVLIAIGFSALFVHLLGE